MGICICSFATLVLYFRVSEKTATPTSIILMSVNTVLGFIAISLHHIIEDASWKSLYVCIPICTIGAPLGAVFSAYWHRLVHAVIIYGVELIQFTGACALIKPWTTHKTNNPALLSVMFLLIVGGLFTFLNLKRCGDRLLEAIPKEELKLSTTIPPSSSSLSSSKNHRTSPKQDSFPKNKIEETNTV